MNLLAYVHLRNIHGSTGAGRVARQLVEHLAQQPDMHLRVLADAGDHRRVVPQVGAPWDRYRYCFFEEETSRQQARWFFTGNPIAESYWPETDLMFCTAESYVPVKRARLAVTLHDAAFFERGAHRPGWAFWKQRLKWQLLFGTLQRRTDLFHTVSHFSAERLAHHFPAIRTRLRVVHNAVPPRFFAPPGEEGRAYLREQGLDQVPFVLLPRGLAYRKNADLVLASWPTLRDKHPELRLVVTSHCDPGYAERAAALGSSVMQAGFVSDEALCALYHAAQVVWFPSLYEGFGLPVVEAMACGTPVVASDASSLPEIAANAALLVPPTDGTAHIDAIDGLLRNAARREEQARLGRERARHFTWQRAAAELRRHFAEVV